jgi:hypothetical protein
LASILGRLHPYRIVLLFFSLTYAARKDVYHKATFNSNLLFSSVPRRTERISSCCIRDEGRLLGIDVKACVLDHLKLLRQRAIVVSVKEKVL